MMALRTSRGFTLIEILVVVSIIAILAGVIFGYARQSSSTSRDIERQADLRALQTAVELYRQKNGRYPEGCNGANNWSGEQGGSYACGGGSQYITGLSPEFIKALPRDPRRGSAPGYAYVTNAAGTVYKIVARETVESETVGYTHPLKSCDVRITNGTNEPSDNDISMSGFCGRVTSGGSSYTFPHSGGSNHSCDYNNVNFNKTYGVWGGFAPLINSGSGQCVDVNNVTDPLNNFVNCNNGNPNTGLGVGAKNRIKADAIQDTASIICK